MLVKNCFLSRWLLIRFKTAYKNRLRKHLYVPNAILLDSLKLFLEEIPILTNNYNLITNAYAI